MPGAPHYFDGVMDGDEMAPFLAQYADSNTPLPAFPARFTALTLNPASSGPRGSVHILQLRLSFRWGALDPRVLLRRHGGAPGHSRVRPNTQHTMANGCDVCTGWAACTWSKPTAARRGFCTPKTSDDLR